MNPDTTLPLDLAPLREGAEEMARDYWREVQAQVLTAAPWAQTPAYGRDVQVGAYARLHSDLTRDDTRDRWVRWGIERDTAAYDAEADAKWSRVVAGGYSEDVMAVLSEGWERAKASDRRVIREQWSNLRDNPEALRAAILAALETR